MAVSTVLTVSSADGTTSPPSRTATLTSDTVIRQSFSVDGSTTNQARQIGFDAANVKFVLITVSGAVTCKTNSTGSPDHTFAWAAAGCLFWSSEFPAAVASPFGSTDVTNTYWTNAGADAVTVVVLIGLNSNPVG